MTLHKVVHDKNNPYTVLNTSVVFDNRISGKAKALWLYAFSRPADWQFYTCEMLKYFKEGEEAIRRGLTELEKAGYLKREQTRLANGRMGPITWVWYEVSQIKLPETGFPGPVKPDPEKQGLPITESKPSIENNNRPPTKEAAPAVVVFPILDELKIPKMLKVKLSSENDEETVCKLVQRVKAWTARRSDAVACNTILAHWETWEDKVPKEDLFHTNRAWAQKALHTFDSPGNKPTVGLYQCSVLSKYVEFTTGTHQPVCFNYDSADFQEQIRLFLNKNGIFL